MVGESSGEVEALTGEFFQGPAGYQLNHVFKRGGFKREDFNIENVLHCRPPNNKLAGQVYEFEAIRRCAHFLDETVAMVQPKAIVALGSIPLRTLTSQSGITRNRGWIYDSKYGIPVIGTFHPSYLLPRKHETSSAKFTWVVIMDFRKALRVAEGKRRLVPQSYLLDPPLDQAIQFMNQYESTPDVTLAWDLETLYKMQVGEQDLKLEGKQPITRISFSWKPGYAMTIPKTPEYWSRVVVPLMRMNRPKVGWNCPLPNQKVLTADLRWVEAGTLKKGDKLIGFDEYPKRGRKARRFRTSIVEHAGRGTETAYRVSFSDGSNVDVTGEHPWLVVGNNSHSNGSRTRWVNTTDLQLGERITRLIQPWEQNDSADAAYLRGLFDGEGHASRNSPGKGRFVVAFSQKAGVVQEEGKRLLRKLGFPFNSKPVTGSHVSAVYLLKRTGLAFLGSVRPLRLLNKFKPEWLRSVYANNQTELQVVGVRCLGRREIVRLSTSTSTYVLEGFGAHNSKGFDEPLMVFQEGMELNGTLHDGMNQFHVFQPNINKGLEFVASIAADHLSAWKHLSQSEPEFYSAVDADATITNHLWLQDVMSTIPVPEYAEVEG